MSRGGRLVVSLVTVILVGIAGMATAREDPDTPRPGGPIVADHVLVRIAPGTPAATALAEETRPVFGRWHRVRVPPGRDTSEWAETLSRNPRVEIASLDPVVQLDPVDPVRINASTATSPDDPHYSYQWHFPLVQLEEAWARSTGREVEVAVVDTGISPEGEDLTCHTFVHPYNAISSSTAMSAATDDHGHGTHVAGTVAQCTGNGMGAAGMAIDADLMPVKVLDSTGSGSVSAVAAGVEWARTHGADVINLSLGVACSAPWPECSQPILDEAIEAATREGIVLVAAAGNNSSGIVSYPANHPDVIAVGAVDLNRDLAHYSNWGTALDVVAPGGDTRVDLNSDTRVDGVLQETFRPPDDWAYYAYQGTSMATAHMAGGAALLRSVFPAVDPTGIRDTLRATTMDLGDPGFDPTFGHGLIQMADALEYLLAKDSSAPGWPGGAALSADVSDTEMTVSWPRANDDLGVVSYRVFVNGEEAQTLPRSQRSARLTGLVSGQTYRIAVRAYDTAGKQSAPLSASFTTADRVAPVWEPGTEVEVTGFGGESLDLAWAAARDNVGVTGYRVRVGDRVAVTTSSRRGTVTGLEPDTTYFPLVEARDGAGNWSGPLTTSVRTPRSFSDVSDSVFLGDILWLSAEDVTRGCNPPTNDRFCPDDPLTRGQMAAFLNRALGLDGEGTTFGDTDGHVFSEEVGRLAAAGITRGCNPPQNDRFCPDDPLTRGQMAAFLNRALPLPASTEDTFGDDDSSVFEADIQALAASGVTRGCNPPRNDHFCPDDPVTRGQMAAFLARALSA